MANRFNQNVARSSEAPEGSPRWFRSLAKKDPSAGQSKSPPNDPSKTKQSKKVQSSSLKIRRITRRAKKLRKVPFSHSCEYFFIRIPSKSTLFFFSSTYRLSFPLLHFPTEFNIFFKLKKSLPEKAKQYQGQRTNVRAKRLPLFAKMESQIINKDISLLSRSIDKTQHKIFAKTYYLFMAVSLLQGSRACMNFFHWFFYCS